VTTGAPAKPASAQHDAGNLAGVPDRPDSAVPAAVAIQLRASELQRGASTSNESPAPVIAIRHGPTRFEIQLPESCPDGLYQVAIVDPFDEVLVEVSAHAVNRVLVADADATGLESGPGFLRIGAAGQPPDYVAIVLEDR